MARFPENRQPYAEIFDGSIEGFATILVHFFFDRKLQVIQTYSDGEEIAMLQNVEARHKIVFPFLSYRITNVANNTTGYNSFMMRKFGVPLPNKATSDLPYNIDKSYTTFKLNPVLVSITVRFIGNDVKDLRLFAQRWIDVANMNFLCFDVRLKGFEDYPFQIKVTADPNVSMPDLTDNGDTGKFFTAETTVQMQTYSGTKENTPAIKKINFNTFEVETTKNLVFANLVRYRDFTVDEYGHVILDGVDLDADDG